MPPADGSSFLSSPAAFFVLLPAAAGTRLVAAYLPGWTHRFRLLGFVFAHALVSDPHRVLGLQAQANDRVAPAAATPEKLPKQSHTSQLLGLTQDHGHGIDQL
jgi:hypothetical protein